MDACVICCRLFRYHGLDIVTELGQYANTGMATRSSQMVQSYSAFDWAALYPNGRASGSHQGPWLSLIPCAEPGRAWHGSRASR
jgi:hypothetical protein